MLLFVCSETAESKLVKQETSCTVILPPEVSVLLPTEGINVGTVPERDGGANRSQRILLFCLSCSPLRLYNAKFAFCCF